jgi:uncharacterized protein
MIRCMSHTLLVVLFLLGCACGGVSEEEKSVDAAKTPAYTNRLAKESSPYLLQHAHNPVDWFPWGDEAFAKARKENKPIFLSIGYSTCHWCHVMERESFENESIAAVLNEHFVAIKVDREERPDVDQVYMAAVQAMTRRGGWPLSVFLTPDLEPFWGGTYFPPEDHGGGAGFRSILLEISRAWKEDRDRLLEHASRLTAALSTRRNAGPGSLDLDTLGAAYDILSKGFDAERGGFDAAPKFPRTHTLTFLLRHHRRTGEARALEMVKKTLRAIWRGGIHDHLGGGLHRYSTDAEWLVPHFEKMLYDQALAARASLETHQVTGDPFFADMARDIFRYVIRDLTDEAGGFQSAEDADSEGVEGKFYVWSRKEIFDVLGKDDGDLFCKLYGVRRQGNFHDEATGSETGTNILNLKHWPADAAAKLELDAGEFAQRLEAMRAKLLAVRGGRIHPLKDDKVLTDWNGLMISALAYGGRVLDEPSYTDAARRAADFVLETMVADGRLQHRYRKGHASIPAFLDDHAFLILGLLDLYESTHEARWLAEAKRLAGEMIRLFGDEAGGFVFTGSDGEKLIAAPRDIYDGATPSGNAVAAEVLLRLGLLTGDADLEKAGRATIAAFAGQVGQYPPGYTYMLMALDFAIGPTREIVLTGDASDKASLAMRRAIRKRFLPRTVSVFVPEGDDGATIRKLVPHLADLPATKKTEARLCQDSTCLPPVATVEELERLLDGSTPEAPSPDDR